MASRGAVESYLFDMDMAERAVDASELEAGDVLLFRSTPFMSRLIRRLDSSSINHVAMVIAPDTVLEAAPGGVASKSLGAAMKDVEYAIVRRASGVSAQGRRVIAEIATSLGGGNYSYETVILHALHIALGEQLPRAVRRFLAWIVSFVRVVVDLILRSKQIPLFCSELIWLAFHKAERTLVIPQYFDPGASAPSEPVVVTGSSAADERYAVLNEERLPRLGDDLIGLFPYVGRATTPQDLYQEASVLTTVGRLQGPALRKRATHAPRRWSGAGVATAAPQAA
jgi:hypothetical protein